MNNNDQPKKDDKKNQDISNEIKKGPEKKDELHKGYNEKNPVQPEGAFKPDSKDDK